jgi:hypothetical protein
MPDVTIDAYSDEIGLASEFGVADELHVPEIFSHSTQKDGVSQDGRDANQGEQE